jgi:hypothetical protein
MSAGAWEILEMGIRTKDLGDMEIQVERDE